jgi:hypothetical protein
VGRIVLFVGSGGNAEEDVEDEDFGAVIGGGVDGVGVVFLPKEGGFGEFRQGVIVDADDDDVFDWLGAAEDEVDVLGFEIQELEEAEVAEAHGDGDACYGYGGDGGGFFGAGAHGAKWGTSNLSVSDLREELRMSDGREERVEREQRIEQERLKERESPREREDVDEWEPERVDS